VRLVATVERMRQEVCRARRPRAGSREGQRRPPGLAMTSLAQDFTLVTQPYVDYRYIGPDGVGVTQPDRRLVSSMNTWAAGPAAPST